MKRFFYGIGYLWHCVFVAPRYTDSDTSTMRTDHYWRDARY